MQADDSFVALMGLRCRPDPPVNTSALTVDASTLRLPEGNGGVWL